jgi:hypothetical protein
MRFEWRLEKSDEERKESKENVGATEAQLYINNFKVRRTLIISFA